MKGSLCHVRIVRRTLATEASLRRSMLYVPASNPRMLKKSLESPADAVAFDLEDSVATAQKNEARRNALDALNAAKRGDRELLVRVNSRATGLIEDDLSVVLSSENIDGIVLPKVNTAEDIRWVEGLISKFASEDVKKRMRIIASIESALAIVNLQEIAQSSSHLDSLLFAAEDFCADTGIQRSPSRQEMLYARSAVVITARAYKLASMDLVCINLDNPETLKEECAEGRLLGFTSKQAIHPKQVEAIHAAFSPSPAAVKRAVAILEQNARHTASGKGAFSFDESGDAQGQTMIDAPMILQATALVKRAQGLKMTIPWTDDRPPVGF